MSKTKRAEPVAERKLIVALAGNPNSGKTTLFNELTGLRYKVANYPGVTVEKKLGNTKLSAEFPEVSLVDLPGIYSLSGTSLDEKIASNYLLGQYSDDPAPDVLVVVLDAANLERNLYLATQLIDLGFPLVLALNMIDLAERQGQLVYNELLARALDVPVVSIVASKGQGVDLLKEAISEQLKKRSSSRRKLAWLPQSCNYQLAAAELGEIFLKEQSSETVSEHSLARLESARDFIGSLLISEGLATNSAALNSRVKELRSTLEKEGIAPATFEASERYQWLNQVARKCSVNFNRSASELPAKIDRILTHKIFGSLIFVTLMFFIFQAIFAWASVPMSYIEQALGSLSKLLDGHLSEGVLKSLIIDGILSGVGNVIIFVPQIAILFFFLGLLEDSGYLARAAFIMDRAMRPFGLQGRSFIPLLSSFACAIPGIMSTRSIPSFTDRLATIFVAPFMSCSARLPVYAVLIAAFIPENLYFGPLSAQGLVLLSMYLLGIIGAAVTAWLLKKTLLKGQPALFVMEMPVIRPPSLKLVLRDVWDRVLTFLGSAGSVILACSVVLWMLASYPKPPDDFTGNKVEYSYAGRLGASLEPIIKPLGFNWEIGVGIVASLAAREVFISALATVYNLEQDEEEQASNSLTNILREKKAQGEFTLPAALSLMVFYVYACQCMSTLAVCRRETGSWAWVALMFTYMTVVAYLAAFATHELATAIL